MLRIFKIYESLELLRSNQHIIQVDGTESAHLLPCLSFYLGSMTEIECKFSTQVEVNIAENEICLFISPWWNQWSVMVIRHILDILLRVVL